MHTPTSTEKPLCLYPSISFASKFSSSPRPTKARRAAHAGGSQGGLGSGMAAANDDDIEILWVKHGVPNGRRKKRAPGAVRERPILPAALFIDDNGAMSKLLVFAGSTRTQSYNRQLAKAAADLARAAGASVTLLELGDLDIPLYNADLEAQGTPPDVMKLKEVLDEHPAWIICSPEYNGSYTALLKNTLDWASSPVKNHAYWSDSSKPFAGKVVGLLSASPGALGGLRSLSHLSPLLLNLQCWLCPQQFALGRAGSAFDAQGQLQDATHQASVAAVVDQVLWAAKRLS
jgi:NAD(P)H-dependent FMN reductase